MHRVRSDVRTVAVALLVSLLVAGGPALASRIVKASSTAQPRCKPGAVLAFASFTDPSKSTLTYSEGGVTTRFNCADSKNRVLVKKIDDTGDFRMAFPGISDSASDLGDMVATLSPLSVPNATIGYFNRKDAMGHVIDVTTTINGSPTDEAFSVVLLGFKRA